VISAIAGVTISEVIGEGGLSVASALVAAALWATASLIYLYFFWGLAGQTPGMRFLGIRIEAAGDPHLGRRRARRRLGGLLLALLPLGLGLLWILVSDDRRGWHDRIASTEVVRVDPRPPPWSDSDSR
jgi:uncharacterized RDD family membrane protein YckC